MKVKALHNLIYDGTFHLRGEVLDMKDTDVTSYENRHWVIRLLQGSKPAVKAPIPDTLPPLEADTGRKKK